jgi:hypothetical protein
VSAGVAQAALEQAAGGSSGVLEFEFAESAKPANGELLLRGADAVRQLNIALRAQTGARRDATRSVKFTIEPAGVVQIDEGGRMSVRGNGSAVVRALHEASGTQAEMRVRVEGAQAAKPINFANDVVPVFTKASCNSGGCHGKSGGQNAENECYKEKSHRLDIFSKRERISRNLESGSDAVKRGNRPPTRM